jgi:hypothetical protein
VCKNFCERSPSPPPTPFPLLPHLFTSSRLFLPHTLPITS